MKHRWRHACPQNSVARHGACFEVKRGTWDCQTPLQRAPGRLKCQPLKDWPYTLCAVFSSLGRLPHRQDVPMARIYPGGALLWCLRRRQQIPGERSERDGGARVGASRHLSQSAMNDKRLARSTPASVAQTGTFWQVCATQKPLIYMYDLLYWRLPDALHTPRPFMLTR